MHAVYARHQERDPRRQPLVVSLREIRAELEALPDNAWNWQQPSPMAIVPR